MSVKQLPAAVLFGRCVLADKSRKTGLIGLGLDGTDGHTRITKGDNFRLVGGSRETHEQMQESCIKFNEKLDARGKSLEQLERAELHDLARECRMNLVDLSRGK